MQQLLEKSNISISVSWFNNILKSSAELHVGKNKPSKKPKLLIYPHVRAKIRNCNHLCRTINQNWQEWIDPCWEANATINEAKANSWKDLFHSSVSSADSSDEL